jgi:geranylgeranyl diphosphate synthase, type III
VEDSAALRRGFPVAHSIYGVPQTINSANYIYFCALRELERLNNPHLFKIFYGSFFLIAKLTIDELINLHRGQGMDLFWRDSLTCPTEQEYIEMVNNKTGGLLRLAVKLMQACSSSSTYFWTSIYKVNILVITFLWST